MTATAMTAEEVADRTIGYLSGAAISAMVYLGDRLGLYRAMRGTGALTSAELASRTGLDERWVREWLRSHGDPRHAGGGRQADDFRSRLYTLQIARLR